MKLLTITLVVTIFGLSPMIQAQDLVYRETFPITEDNNTTPRTSTGDIASLDTGWAVGFGTTIDQGMRAKSDFNIGGSTGLNNNPQGQIDAGIFWSTTTGATVSMFTYETPTIAANTLDTFGVDYRKDQQAAEMRFAFENNGQWVVSSIVNLVGDSQNRNVTFSTADDWFIGQASFGNANANFNINNAGAAVDPRALTGNVTGFGIVYSTQTNGNVRFDNFSVETSPVPEPSFGLGLGGLLLLALRRRRDC